MLSVKYQWVLKLFALVVFGGSVVLIFLPNNRAIFVADPAFFDPINFPMSCVARQTMADQIDAVRYGMSSVTPAGPAPVIMFDPKDVPYLDKIQVCGGRVKGLRFEKRLLHRGDFLQIVKDQGSH